MEAIEHVGIEPRNEIERAYLEHLSAGRFATLFCDECGRARFYPRAHCPHCGARGGSWRDLPRAGTVRTYTVVARPPDPAFATPYVVGIVRLSEDVSILTRIEGVDADELRIDLPVRIVVRALAPWEQKLPVAVAAEDAR